MNELAHPYFLAPWRTRPAPRHARYASPVVSPLTLPRRRAPRAHSGTSLLDPEAQSVARVSLVGGELHQCRAHAQLAAP
jgi:hypothetical protein